VEYSTNTSLFAQGPMGGRRLDDLDPLMGRIAVQLGMAELGPSGRPDPVGGGLLESVVAASPMSRWLNMLKVGTAPKTSFGEKALNLLSGGRTRDFTTEQVTREIRDRMNALQVQAGARPLSIVSGTEKLMERLAETGDTEKLQQLKQIEKSLQWLRKKLKEETPGGQKGRTNRREMNAAALRRLVQP
jgi:hypothetical protein